MSEQPRLLDQVRNRIRFKTLCISYGALQASAPYTKEKIMFP